MGSDQAGLTTEQFFGILRRRGLWIVLCIVLLVAVAYGYSKHEAKKYTATASVSFGSNSLSQLIAGLPASSNNNSASAILAQQESNIELATSGAAAEKTARLMGGGLTAAAVSSNLHITAKGESSIVEIEATATSPQLASAIANTYARQVVVEQQGANRRLFRSALAVVHKQLAELPPAQRVGPDGLDLQNRAHTLGLLAGLDYNNVLVSQEAAAPSSPSSPKTKKNIVVGAIAGLLLGLVIAFWRERIDKRVRRPRDLEQAYGLPLLGEVPKSRSLSKRRSSDAASARLPLAEAEAFNLIRAHIRFLHIERDIRTLLVVSPAPGEGRTTIARNLAEAAARSGSRALLVEADLRHPGIADQLGLAPGSGLAEVLSGAATVLRGTQSVASAGTAGHSLDVIAAGAALPPNPSELVESRAMYALIDQAKVTYDLVVVDTAPLMAFSDAFPLLSKVDGVVVVGRIGQSRGDIIEETRNVLVSSGAKLLGVVANVAKPTGSGAYAHPAVSAADDTSVAADRGGAEELVPTARA
jgi:capsular exopolysaccharide synthesis family protein